MAYSQQIASATIAMEADGEGPEGELAVAHVLLNRLATGRWGHSLAHVCLAAEQFSCWNTTDPNRIRIAEMMNTDTAIQRAEQALAEAQQGTPDPTGGATHYYSVTMPQPPSWAAEGHFLVQIGKHRFYNNVA